MTGSCGKTIRMARLLAGPDGRAACLAFDHGLHIGPIPGARQPREVIAAAVEARLDGIILSPGLVTAHADLLAGRDKPSVILRLDQTTMWRIGAEGGHEEGHCREVATVEDALALGADAVLTYLFIGHADPALETRSVEIAVRAARDARRLGVPLILEPMAARAGRVSDVFDAEIIEQNCRMAVEIGADIIKTDWSGDAKSFRRVVEAAGAPVLVAGGPKPDGAARGKAMSALSLVDALLDAGAKGILFGRQLFQADDPAATMKAARDRIHETLPAPKRTGARTIRRGAKKNAA